MIIKYRTERYSGRNPIHRERFAKESEKTLTDFHGRKHTKITQYYGFYDTWAEAKAALVQDAKEKVEQAERRATEARETLARFEALIDPAEQGKELIT